MALNLGDQPRRRAPRSGLGAALLAGAAVVALRGTAFATAPYAAERQVERLSLRGSEPLLSTAAPRVSADASAEGTGFGYAVKAAAAAATFAFACGAAERRAAQKRETNVARQMFPSACGIPKQKVLRRLEPYGEVPAWSRRPLMKRVCRKPWRTRFTGKLSPYGRELVEKQRIRYHYNVKESQLQVYARKAFKKGVEYPVDNLLQQLESRLDNIVWRCGLAPTMAGARHFVKEGHIQWRTGDMEEWRTVNVPSLRLKVGDTFRVRDAPNSQNYGKLNQEDEGPVTVPEHITWDRDTMSGSYNGICDREDFGINIEERFIINWYTGQGKYLKKSLRIRHMRYHPGTSRLIKKTYNGGRTRPTPENLMNIKRGIGLNRRGRSRPPCLWGRRKPLNSPYEVSSRL